MRNFKQPFFLVCGLLLMLAAVPVFAQQQWEDKVKVNKKPLEDFAQTLKREIDAREVDLTKSFAVELEGVLDANGQFDRRKSKFTKSEGDAAMIEVGKSFVEAVGDSGVFQYLQNFAGIGKLTLAVSQNETQVMVGIKSETETANRAKVLASGINMLVKTATMQKTLGEDEKTLFNNIAVTTSDKNLVINFAAARETVHALMKKYFEKTMAKPPGE